MYSYEKKYAALKYFEFGSSFDSKIQSLEDSEEKKGMIMVASQLFFYADETGLKFFLGMGNYGISRYDILLELRTFEGSGINEEELKKIEDLYMDLLVISLLEK